MRRQIRKTTAAVFAVCLMATSLVAVSVSGAGAQSSEKLVIPIGMILPDDSPVISFGVNHEALEASVEGFNKRNKDIEFDLFFCDEKFDPNLSADCARQMVDREVVATVGDIASGNAAAVDEILKEAGIPRVALSMISLPEFGSEVSYPVSSGPFIALAGELQQFGEEGLTKLSVLHQESPQAGAIVGLLEGPAEASGVEIVKAVAVPQGTTDYSSYVADAADGTDGIACLCTPTEGLPASTAAAQLGLDIAMSQIILGFSLDQIVETGHKNWVFSDSFPAPSKVNVKQFPNLKLFLDDMKAAKSSDLKPGKLTGAMIQGWLGLQAITELAKGETSITSASLKSSLDSAQDIDMLGLTPPWTPSQPGPTDLFSRSSNPILWRAKFKNNKIVSTKKNPIDTTELFVAGG